jgi:hypothetical protein
MLIGKEEDCTLDVRVASRLEHSEWQSRIKAKINALLLQGLWDLAVLNVV